MFTLYRTVKRSVAESVPDRTSVHTRNAAFEAVSPQEQNCSAPLLKVEHSVSDRFLKRFESSLNTLSEQKLQRNLVLVNNLLRESCKLCDGWGLCLHWERLGIISALQQNTNSCSHCIGAAFETEQNSVRYSVNIA